MPRGKTELPADLRSCQEQFSNWRSTHPPQYPYPEHFWVQAAKLADKYGRTRVRNALKIDYDNLKRHLDSLAAKEPDSSEVFVELQPGVILSECTIECRKASGDCMRISFQGSISDLQSFCSEFWGKPG